MSDKELLYYKKKESYKKTNEIFFSKHLIPTSKEVEWQNIASLAFPKSFLAHKTEILGGDFLPSNSLVFVNLVFVN